LDNEETKINLVHPARTEVGSKQPEGTPDKA